MKKLIAVLTILLLINSCYTTKWLWNKDSYIDSFRSFITTRDHSQIVFLGDKYHYSFKNTNTVIDRLLFWKQHYILYIDLNNSELQLDQKNNISGYVTIKSSFSDLNIEDEIYLKSLGFSKNEQGYWLIRIELNGKRYLPNGTKYDSYPTNREYEIKIYYPENNNQIKKLGKAIATPFTIVLDAVIGVGRILAIPVGL